MTSTKSKSNKSATKNATDAGSAGAGMDQETIRTTLRGAKEGSTDHIMMLPQLMRGASASQVAEAITICCTILDQPAFASEYGSSRLSSSVREQASYALISLSEIPDTMLASAGRPNVKSLHQSRLEKNWPIIFNAMQYFYRKSCSSLTPMRNSERALKLKKLLVETIPTIVLKITGNDESFERMIIQDDTLLNILVRIWLTPDIMFELVPTCRHRFNCYPSLARSFSILQPHDPSFTRLARIVHEVLHEMKMDRGNKLQAIVQHCWDPEKSSERPTACAITAISFMRRLIDGRSTDDSERTSKFMDKVVKDGALPVILKWLTFIHGDIRNPPSRRVLSNVDTSTMFRVTCGLLYACVTCRNALHWSTRLFESGLLSALAHILEYPQFESDSSRDALSKIFRDIVSQYTCHRSFLLPAVKAVKEITANGDIAVLESGSLREPWMSFTNVLMERLALYTACNRDFGYSSGRTCASCKKAEDEIPLLKCAGCRDAVYCSRSCQITSWKTGGHRQECQNTKQAIFSTGMGKPTDSFSRIVALAELRRHMPGLTQHRDPQNLDDPLDVPFKNTYFSVFLRQTPTTIEVLPRQTLPEDHKWHTSASDHVDEPMNVCEVMTFVGGKKRQVTAVDIIIPPYFEWFAPGKRYNGNVKFGGTSAHLMQRKPAQSRDKKPLAFALDEVDCHVMDARKNFRPPAPGDEKSPKTIYDYIEAKVADDPDMLAWLAGWATSDHIE